MGITIAPIPSIGELIAQWGIYFNNVATGFRMSRNFPTYEPPGLGSSSGTIYSTEIFGGGVGLAAGMVSAPGTSAPIRPEVELHAGNTNDGVPEFIPWAQLVSNPVVSGLPDFRYTVRSYHFARLTVGSVADQVLTAFTLSIGPGWGLGVGNPGGGLPQNPALGFVLDRASPNWFARLYPGQGFWTPTVDVDTGVAADAWHELGLIVSRIGGNAVISWEIDRQEVAQFRPVAPVPLYSFLSRWNTAPMISSFRESGATDDGMEHYMGGPGPMRVFLQT